MAGGSNNNEGRVEYCNGSIWRSVRIIGGNVDDTDATIICRQLGLSDIGKLNFYTISKKFTYIVTLLCVTVYMLHAGIRERSRGFPVNSRYYSRSIVFEDVNSCIGTESKFADCYRLVRVGELPNTDSRSPSGDIAVTCITGLLCMLNYIL